MADADNNITFRNALDAMYRGDAVEALAALLPLAEKDHPEAQAAAGSIYAIHSHRIEILLKHDAWESLQGDESETWEHADFPEAIKWLTKASGQGVGTASHNLAMLYLGKPKMIPWEEARPLARFYYRRAHEQGCTVMIIPEDVWEEQYK